QVGLCLGRRPHVGDRVGDQAGIAADRRVAAVDGAVKANDQHQPAHLIDPAADSAPRMNCRCRIRKKIISGSVVKVAAAASPGMSVPLAPANVDRPTSTGWIDSLLVITSGHRKLFQLPMKVLIAMIARAGRTAGTPMLQSTRIRPAPSTVAASRISCGIV